MLRGLNLPIEAKLPDFEPLKNNTPLHVMPLYGANIARVLFTWEAFEPERGNYSMQYLDYYMGVVEVCCSFRNSRTLLRCHPLCYRNLHRPERAPLAVSWALWLMMWTRSQGNDIP